MIQQNDQTARERNRHGIRTLLTSLPPEYDEMRIDRLSLYVDGLIGPCTAEVISNFIQSLNYTPAEQLDPPPPFFGASSGEFGPEILSGFTISGKMQLGARRENGRVIQLRLALNPTRTFNHVIASYPGYEVSFSEYLSGLSPRAFFRSNSEVTETTQSQSYNLGDNMLPNFDRAGSSVFLSRNSMWAEFLVVYFEKLEHLFLDEVIARGRDFDPVNPARVSLNFAVATVRQIEIYFERHSENALFKMHRASSRALASALRAHVDFYEGAAVNRVARDVSSPVITIEQSSSVPMTVYAKAQERIRFEMKYNRDLSNSIRPTINTLSSERGEAVQYRSMSILDKMALFTRNASERFLANWPGLQSVFAEPLESDTVGTIASLSKVVMCCCRSAGCEEVFADVLELLLRGGSISGSEINVSHPQRLLTELEHRGVIGRVRLRSRLPRGASRRYSLLDPYRNLREQLLMTVNSEAMPRERGE